MPFVAESFTQFYWWTSPVPLILVWRLDGIRPLFLYFAFLLSIDRFLLYSHTYAGKPPHRPQSISRAKQKMEEFWGKEIKSKQTLLPHDECWRWACSLRKTHLAREGHLISDIQCPKNHYYVPILNLCILKSLFCFQAMSHFSNLCFPSRLAPLLLSSSSQCGRHREGINVISTLFPASFLCKNASCSQDQYSANDFMHSFDDASHSIWHTDGN